VVATQAPGFLNGASRSPAGHFSFTLTAFFPKRPESPYKRLNTQGSPYTPESLKQAPEANYGIRRGCLGGTRLISCR
jgi:hypothetical protein